MAAAVPNSLKAEKGSVVFFNKQMQYLGFVQAGVLPDMITALPDVSGFIVANEGEPNADYSVDPNGSVSVVN
jgi:hypothetical protein